MYRRAYHVSTRELSDIATRAKPRLLILTHRGNAGCDQSHAAGDRQAVLDMHAEHRERQDAGKIRHCSIGRYSGLRVRRNPLDCAIPEPA